MPGSCNFALFDCRGFFFKVILMKALYFILPLSKGAVNSFIALKKPASAGFFTLQFSLLYTIINSRSALNSSRMQTFCAIKYRAQARYKMDMCIIGWLGRTVDYIVASVISCGPWVDFKSVAFMFFLPRLNA